MNYQVSSTVCRTRLAVIAMSQIKIYGLRSSLSLVVKEISDVIHSCVVDTLQYGHRFAGCGNHSFQTPMHNWGFRGLPGDEHSLNYKVNV